jgi:DtxR family Mn-dependent transcriptional regulator
VLLAQAPVGHEGRVLRVADTDPDLLCALEDLGLGVSSRLRVTAAGVELDGASVRLPAGASEVVWVTA